MGPPAGLQATAAGAGLQGHFDRFGNVRVDHYRGPSNPWRIGCPIHAEARTASGVTGHRDRPWAGTR